MPRYVKQTDLFRCGPVVIANAMKWAGVSYSWAKNKKKLTKLCNSDPNKSGSHPLFAGTTQQEIDRALRKTCGELLRIRRVIKLTLKQIDEHLDGGNSIVLCIIYNNEYEGVKFKDCHIFLCTDRTCCYYTVVNLSLDLETVSRLHRNTFKRMIRRHRKYNNAWFLTKRK